MSGVVPFQFGEHEVRTLTLDGEPWFVAADVARILGYSATAAMTRSMDDDEKGVRTLHTPSGDQDMTVITEAGLYAAILRSTIPTAKAFKRWVTHDVLPTLRRTGHYGSDIGMLTELPSSQLLMLAAEAAKKLEDAQRQIEADAPKVEAYDSFLDADGTYSIGAVAKMIGRSQNKLFDLLRNAGVLIAKGPMRNTPYQQYMHHFTVKAHEYPRSDGTTSASYTTRVQPSGVDFIRRKLGVGVDA